MNTTKRADRMAREIEPESRPRRLPHTRLHRTSTTPHLRPTLRVSDCIYTVLKKTLYIYLAQVGLLKVTIILFDSCTVRYSKE